jgi:hypothetical protein
MLERHGRADRPGCSLVCSVNPSRAKTDKSWAMLPRGLTGGPSPGLIQPGHLSTDQLEGLRFAPLPSDVLESTPNVRSRALGGQ